MALDLEIGIVANPQSALAAFDSMRGAAGAASSAAVSDFERMAAAAGLSTDAIQKLNASFGSQIESAKAASAIEHARTQLMSMGVAAGLSASELQKMGASIGMTAKETEAHTIKVSGSFARMAEASGMSATQLSNVTRMLPMQLTDVVTSLASGMPAYMVAIQQGGQIKDMYGSMGLAARALAEYVLGLINPLTLAAGAVGVLALAYNQGSKEADAYRLALVNTGNAAGVTTWQLAGMAKHVSDTVGTTGAAAEALAALAATGKVAGGDLERFAESALWAQKGLGVGVGETAKVFAELGKSPAEASAKLNESLNYLTASTYRQIRAAEEIGDKEGAAAIAQRAYSDAIEERGKKMVASMGTLERAWMGIAGAAKGAWDAMLDIGREEDPTAKAAAAAVKLLDLRAQLQQAQGGGAGVNYQGLVQLKAEIAEQEKLVAATQKKTAADNEDAKARAKNAALEQKRIEWDKGADSGLSPEALALKKARKIREEGLAAGADMGEINARVGIVLQPLAAQGLQREMERLKEYQAQIVDGEKLTQAALAAEHSAGLIESVSYFEKKKQLALNANTDQQAVIELEIEATKRSGIAQAEKASKLAGLNAELNKLERERVAVVQQAEIDIAAARQKTMQRNAADVIKDASEALEARHKLELVKDADYYENAAKNEAAYQEEKLRLAEETYMAAAQYAKYGSDVEFAARAALRKVERDIATERELAGRNALATAYEYGRTTDLALQRQSYEASLVLQTSEERTKLLAIYDIEAAKLEKIRQIMATTPEGEARDKSIADIEAAAAKAKQGEVSKALNAEWKTHLDFAEGVAKGIWDDYTSGAGNAAQNALAKLKKELFDEIYKLALKPLVLNVVANITGNPVGGGGIGGNSLMGMAGNALSGLEIGGSTLGAWGGGISSGFSAGLSGNAANFMGPTLPGFEAGAAIAEAVPYAAAAYAAYKIIDSFSDNNAKVGGTYQYTAGSGVDVWKDEAGRTRLGTDGREIGDNLIQASIQKTTDTINKVLEQIGSVSRVKTLIAGAQSSSEKPEAMIEAYGMLDTGKKFGVQGEQKLNKTASPEEVYGALQTELNRAVLDAVKNAAEIPKSVKDMLQKVDPRGIENDKFNEYISRIVKDAQTAIAQEVTGLDVSGFGDLMRGMADDGINAAQYMTDGMSASIQGAMAGKLQSDFNAALYDAIILPMATTHTFSKAAAESIIADLQAKTAALKTLFSSEEFKSAMADMGSVLAEAQEPMRELNSYIPQTSKSVKSLADTASSAGKDIADAAKKEADEKKGLQDKLDALTMTRAQLLEKERNAVSESNRALFDELKAREALDAAQKLSQAELKKQAGLQADLIEAQGDAVTAREMRRVAAIKEATDGMNAYNSELVAGSMIATNALEDQVTAAKELQSITNSLGDKYSSLQVDLLTAKGDEAGAKRLKRQQELDNLLLNKSDADAAEITNIYNRNAAIEDQIELANKAKKADDERKGLQNRLDSLTMTRAQLLSKERDAIGEANRALFDRLKAQEELDAAQKISQSEFKKQESLRADLIEAQGNAAAATEMRRAAALKEATDGMNEYNAKLVASAMNATSALEDMLQATKTWKSISEGMKDEVKKLRGELLGNTEQGLAAAQAEFEIARAQAAAGDQKAAEKLSGLAENVVSIAKNSGLAGADLRQIIGETAFSLEGSMNAAKAQVESFAAKASAPLIPYPAQPQISSDSTQSTAIQQLTGKVTELILTTNTQTQTLSNAIAQPTTVVGQVSIAGPVRTI